MLIAFHNILWESLLQLWEVRSRFCIQASESSQSQAVIMVSTHSWTLPGPPTSMLSPAGNPAGRRVCFCWLFLSQESCLCQKPVSETCCILVFSPLFVVVVDIIDDELLLHLDQKQAKLVCFGVWGGEGWKGGASKAGSVVLFRGPSRPLLAILTQDLGLGFSESKTVVLFWCCVQDSRTGCTLGLLGGCMWR